MSLKASLRALERRFNKHARCQHCDGRGSYDTVVECHGVLNRQPRPCKGCGKIACVKRIILED